MKLCLSTSTELLDFYRISIQMFLLKIYLTILVVYLVLRVITLPIIFTVSTYFRLKQIVFCNNFQVIVLKLLLNSKYMILEISKQFI